MPSGILLFVLVIQNTKLSFLYSTRHLLILCNKHDSGSDGYAFKNHWMWYNGVPNSILGSSSLVALIVWKDQNCQNWKNIGQSDSLSTSAFTTYRPEQPNCNCNWYDNLNLPYQRYLGTTHGLMATLQAQSGFSSGGYSIIMAHEYRGSIFGYVCRVGDNFYDSAVNYGSLIISDKNLGLFYIFQTR